MVWTPESRISPGAARKLQGYLQNAGSVVPGNPPPKALDGYISRALELWNNESPDDSDLRDLLNGSSWTDLHRPSVILPGSSVNQLPQGVDIPMNCI